MNSFEIRELENRIIEILNEANIPLEVKRLIALDVLRKTEKAADEEIKIQMKEKEKTDEQVISEN